MRRANLARWIGCHGRPERSVRIRGWRLPICARCTGLFVGYAALPLAWWAGAAPSVLTGLLLLAPMAIDGATQVAGLRESNNSLRLTTGVLGGFGQAMIVAALGACARGIGEAAVSAIVL